MINVNSIGLAYKVLLSTRAKVFRKNDLLKISAL